MAYFNHSFRKSFVGTKATQAESGGVSAGVNDGFLLTDGVHSHDLANTSAPYALGKGVYGFFDPETYLSVDLAWVNTSSNYGKPLVLASTALMDNDKIGPFHGGYKESNKSKKINPRYVHRFYKMTSASPEQSIVHVGNTNYNGITASITNAGVTVSNGTFTDLTVTGGSGTGLTVDITVAGAIVTEVRISNTGTGYLDGEVLTIPDQGSFSAATQPTITLDVPDNRCTFEFLCGENYNLAIELSGSPVLRLLNHNAYRTLSAYTGCCPSDDVAPSAVDSTLVFINWANQIINDNYLKDFIRPIVYTEAGQPLFATSAEAVAEGYPSSSTWDNYVSPGHVDGELGGIRLIGAYIDTKFGNCTFQLCDFFEKEIVQMNVTLTDLTGDPCLFEGLCVNVEHEGFQGQGFGETIVRDLILDESYLQNHFHTDLRIREITQGEDILSAIDRNGLYTRYVIQHSVPRYNNPSGIYDHDQYSLNVYVPASAGSAASFETFVNTWLQNAGVPVTLETYGHTAYTPIPV